MASTNKTTNLGLNQWILSDPFLMEDMNADNQKIDAAVSANPNVKLISVKTSANASQVDFDLSGIDLTKYAALKIEACYCCTPASTVGQVYIRINNISTASYYRPATSCSSAGYTSVLFSPYASYLTNVPASFNAEISGISGAPDTLATTKMVFGAITYFGYITAPEIGTGFGSIGIEKTTAISSINITSCSASGYIQAGSEFTLYGVKK